VPVAHDLDRHFCSHRCSGDHALQSHGLLYWGSLVRDDDIALFETALIGWAVFLHIADDGAFGVFNPERFPQILIEVLNTGSYETTHDLSGLDQTFIDRFAHTGGNGKAHTLITTALREDRCVNADQLALRVDQGTA